MAFTWSMSTLLIDPFKKFHRILSVKVSLQICLMIRLMGSLAPLSGSLMRTHIRFLKIVLCSTCMTPTLSFRITKSLFRNSIKIISLGRSITRIGSRMTLGLYSMQMLRYGVLRFNSNTKKKRSKKTTTWSNSPSPSPKKPIILSKNAEQNSFQTSFKTYKFCPQKWNYSRGLL